MGSAVQPHGGLPPMWLGVFETAQQAQIAVTAFQPILPELAEHWHGSQSTNRSPLNGLRRPEARAQEPRGQKPKPGFSAPWLLRLRF